MSVTLGSRGTEFVARNSEDAVETSSVARHAHEGRETGSGAVAPTGILRGVNSRNIKTKKSGSIQSGASEAGRLPPRRHVPLLLKLTVSRRRTRTAACGSVIFSVCTRGSHRWSILSHVVSAEIVIERTEIVAGKTEARLTLHLILVFEGSFRLRTKAHA